MQQGSSSNRRHRSRGCGGGQGMRTSQALPAVVAAGLEQVRPMAAAVAVEAWIDSTQPRQLQMSGTKPGLLPLPAEPAQALPAAAAAAAHGNHSHMHNHQPLLASSQEAR